MADKIVIYSKRSGEALVPLTVRIEWLPNGTIKPIMFWMPDGACYKIISQSESISLAFLKDRGEGLRFKVKAEVIEMPEYDDDFLYAQYETYLYLADKIFCAKNIIDERYGHAGKEYISVTMDVFSDGDYELVYFWINRERYIVEKTIDIAPRGSFKAGGVGIWHKVKARQVNGNDDEDPNPSKSVRRLAALYLELNKWFVCKSA